MNLKRLLSRKTIHCLSNLNGKSSSQNPYFQRHFSTLTHQIPLFICSPNAKPPQNPYHPKSTSFFTRHIHSTQQTQISYSATDPISNSAESEEEDSTMTEFLSRFVWIMRSKISEAYPDCDKDTINAMLLVIVGKVVEEMEKGGIEQMLGASAATPSPDFSEDLWRTVWEVSMKVLEDMEKARKKEKMKGFLLSEEVQEMCRFAGEIGIKGNMLREMRFKWAREKMEENEFYESLERIREEAKGQEEQETECEKAEIVGDEEIMEKAKVVSLPKRHGKIKYKIYGLDFSDPKWAEVADKINEAGELIWPQESKPISGKCKLVTERILSLKEDEDPSPLLAEWIELLQPSRIDWISLLDRLKEENAPLYFKVAELVLVEPSYQTTIRDYSKLIDAHAKENRLEDVERILKKMNDNGFVPDILTTTVLIQMYSKARNLDRAKEAFESLRSQGFRPDVKVYNSMIMVCITAGEPKMGESLVREMETRDIEVPKETYMALLRSFAQRGDVKEARRIATTMQFVGFQPSLEFCTLLVEVHGQAGEPDQARSNFDHMIEVGLKPDDRCTASMLAAYAKQNLLDQALTLLLQLEKDGFEPGVATYTVLVDWLGKLQLVDETEQLLGKIAVLGEAPPLKVHVSLCDMYARAGVEKKALQALGVLEAKKEQLGPEEFERIIEGLKAGGFLQDAKRLRGLMEAQGFAAPEPLLDKYNQFRYSRW